MCVKRSIPMQKRITRKEIKAYILPEFKTLNALLTGFRLTKSLKALILLQAIFSKEICEKIKDSK